MVSWLVQLVNIENSLISFGNEVALRSVIVVYVEKDDISYYSKTIYASIIMNKLHGSQLYNSFFFFSRVSWIGDVKLL